MSRWRGVALTEGDNRLTALVVDVGGHEVSRLERDVHYSGGPVRAEFLLDQSQLVADGRTKPVLALRLFDSAGHPARRGTVGIFNVAPPYRSWWEVATLNDNQLVAVGNREPTYTVGDNGMAEIELEPNKVDAHAIPLMELVTRLSSDNRRFLRPSSSVRWPSLTVVSAGTTTITQPVSSSRMTDLASWWGKTCAARAVSALLRLGLCA